MRYNQQTNPSLRHYRDRQGNICEKKADDTLLFTSKFEGEVYRTLASQVNPSWIRVQQSLIIKPATPRFPERTWKCDFRVQPPSHIYYPTINIEAKGLVNRDFRIILEQLEYFTFEEFERLWVILPRCTKAPKWLRDSVGTVTDIDGLKTLLKTLGKTAKSIQ